MPGTHNILLLGSGYVAGPCLEYLLRRPENRLTVASRRMTSAQALCPDHPNAKPFVLDVADQTALEAAVAEHDVVISLVPYTHHAAVIQAAIKHRKHVVTTSYVSPAMAALHDQAKEAGITVMNEIGVDPGVDHLYALKTIWNVHKQGGKIVHFTSYCGGLPAPECSNNPLGYKFSWSSRGVLLALRNEAKYIEQGKAKTVPGPELLKSAKNIYTGFPAFAFVGYPNRDSTPYDKRYDIPEAQTIIRGTLRYTGFPEFMQAMVDIGFLDTTDQAHLAASAPEITWDQDDESLKSIIVARAHLSTPEAAARVIDGMKWIGMFSQTKATRRGTPLDTLCATLEEKMQYGEKERDMVFLQHRFEVETKDGRKETHTSTMVEFGQPGGASAMAKTVGVPCGVATQLILDGVITEKGVLAPMQPHIVNPLMEALEKEGITMVEEVY
ncbi:saccharopine dehydrogenase (NADP+, L-glutamate-forming) [Sorochytrium milnesiophthora]